MVEKEAFKAWRWKLQHWRHVGVGMNWKDHVLEILFGLIVYGVIGCCIIYILRWWFNWCVITMLGGLESTELIKFTVFCVKRCLMILTIHEKLQPIFSRCNSCPLWHPPTPLGGMPDATGHGWGKGCASVLCIYTFTRMLIDIAIEY